MLRPDDEAQQETRDTYDVIAAEYLRRSSPVPAQVLSNVQAFAAELPSGSRVADVGCGPGIETRLLREHGLHVFGFDLSIGQLRAGGLAGVAQADMRRLPMATGAVDAIWCQAALLHLPRQSVPSALAEFARVTRPGGGLYLHVAEGDGESWEQAAYYGSDRRRWFTFHRLPDLAAQLEAAGFRIHKTRQTRERRDWLAVHATRAARSAAE